MKNRFFMLASGVVLVLAVLLVAVYGLLREKGHESKHYDIGIVMLTAVDEMTMQGFKDKLNELGYREGDNVTYYFDGPIVNMEQNFQKRAASLKKERLDLIMVCSTTAAIGVKQAFAGSGIPIVFCPVSDPVAADLVDNLQRPGGDITGVKLVSAEDQRLKWLRELLPDAKKVFVPYSNGNKSAVASIEQITPAAKKLGIELDVRGYGEVVDMDALTASIGEGTDAIFLPRDSRMESRIDAFASYAIANKLPLSAPSFIQVKRGALFSYGHVHYNLGKQAGRMAHQIFSGVDPGSLPVEMGENQFTLNIATAKKIGLEVPAFVIKQADQLIRE